MFLFIYVQRSLCLFANCKLAAQFSLFNVNVVKSLLRRVDVYEYENSRNWIVENICTKTRVEFVFLQQIFKRNVESHCTCVNNSLFIWHFTAWWWWCFHLNGLIKCEKCDLNQCDWFNYLLQLIEISKGLN